MKPVYVAVLFLFLTAAACSKGTVDPKPDPGPDPKPVDSTTNPTDTSVPLVLSTLSGNYRVYVNASFQWYYDTARSYNRSFDTLVSWVFYEGSVAVYLRPTGPDSLPLKSVTDSLVVFEYISYAPRQYRMLEYYPKTGMVSFKTSDFVGHGYQEHWSAMGAKE